MKKNYINAEVLPSLAGTFWDEIYEDDDLPAILRGRVMCEAQTNEDRKMLQACLGRATTPIYRKILWLPVSVQQNKPTPAPAIVSLPVLTDRITAPRLILFEGLDYVLKDGFITFLTDPFAEPGLEQKPVLDAAGRHICTQITLWAHNAKLDQRLLDACWGTLLDINLPSSCDYRELLCIMYDALGRGMTELQLRQLLGLLYGSPITKSEELVEVVTKDWRGWFVATDKYIYRSTSGEPCVEVGQRLQAGDPVYSSISFHRGELPNTVAQLTIPSGFFDAQIGHDLVFPNRTVPVVRDGARIEFELGGEQTAVRRFWEMFNTGTLIGDLFGTEVNPADFVLKNILHNVLVCVTTGTRPEHLAGIAVESLLRTLVPPHMAVITISRNA